MDHANVEQTVQAALERKREWIKQAEDAKTHAAAALGDVRGAINAIEVALDGVPKEQEAGEFMTELIGAITQAEVNYSERFDDEDGLGVQTFREVQRALEALR